MSDGLKLLEAICRDQSRNYFQRLRPEYFSETERPAYDRIYQFLRDFGHLPNAENLRAEGIRLFPTTEQIPELLGRILDRMAYNVLGSRWQNLQDMLTQRRFHEVSQIIAEIHQELRINSVEDQVVDLPTAFLQVLEEADRTRQAQGLAGVTLGIPVLDRLTQGASPGDVVTIVARPQLGKSWTMLRMALSAWEAGNSILFVSMEMSNVQTARRGLSLLGNICPTALATGNLDYTAVDHANEVIARAQNGAPFRMLAGDIKKSVDDIDALVQEYGPSMLFIDASYLLRPPPQSKMKRWESASEVAEEIKHLAITRNLPVIQSVQFNRGSTKDERGGGLEHIGLTDAIGQLSSLVIGITQGREPNEETERVYTIHKNRQGPKGKFAVSFAFNPAPRLEFIPPSLGGIPASDGGIELPETTWGDDNDRAF